MSDANYTPQTVIQQAEELAVKLLGTCEGVPDEVFDVEGLAEALDERVRLCESCGWWVEADEIDDDSNCTDCA